ncbi:MAG: hypothetical protein IPK67_09595 [Planctomycetes bacterium]|nr:hypothetical protein [Planctomycetota bacterium]
MAKEAHPEEVLDGLRASLGRGAPAPGYVVRGEELFYRNGALDLLRGRARELQYEVCVHDVKESAFEVTRLQDDLVGGGLFSAGRLVVIHAPEDLLKKDGGAERPVARAIGKFLTAKAGSVVLVAEGLRADNAVVKAIVAAGGALLTFRRLYDKPAPWDRDPDPRRTEVVQWTVARAKELGLKLSGEGAVLVVSAVGSDLCALDSKLGEFRHSGGQEYLRQLEASAPVSPFDLAGSLARGEVAAALRGLEGLFHSGFKAKDGKLEVKGDALREILFNGLRSQVRKGAAASAALQAGKSEEEALGLAGVSAYQMRDFQAALGARDAAGWRAMSADLTRLERKSRRGHEVDVNDLFRFALRWRRARAAARP